MTEENDSELLLEWVDKGISLQRSEKHKEAIVCFDKAINLDKTMGGEAAVSYTHLTLPTKRIV